MVSCHSPYAICVDCADILLSSVATILVEKLEQVLKDSR